MERLMEAQMTKVQARDDELVVVMLRWHRVNVARALVMRSLMVIRG